MLIVAAIGGNAILRKNEKPSVNTQMKNIAHVSRELVAIAKKHNLVLTHGNGPQVGNILIRSEEALGKAYPLPLFACVAESQGEIGFMIEQSIQNELSKEHIKKDVVTVLTQTIVDKNDPSIKNPSKPIGPYYTKKEAMHLKKKGFTVAKDPRGGYRRIVPSPKPIKIIETDTIKKLANSGVIVVSVGGGGIPVFKNHSLKGIDAVIDKDAASACLAKSISADALLILTDVSHAYMNYKKPGQKKLTRIHLKDIEKYHEEGHFSPGSMGPKIEAAIDFIKNGGKKCIITNMENVQKALDEDYGTVIVK